MAAFLGASSQDFRYSTISINIIGLGVVRPPADYYLSWLEPLDALGKKFNQLRACSERLGREPKVAVRVDILACDSDAEAWADAGRSFERADKAAADQLMGRRSDSVGAQRKGIGLPMADRIEDLVVSPNIFAGLRILGPGPAYGIVGDYPAAAEPIDGPITLGVDAFILAGTPHLEEASRVGEVVLALVRATPADRSLVGAQTPTNTTPRPRDKESSFVTLIDTDLPADVSELVERTTADAAQIASSDAEVAGSGSVRRPRTSRGNGPAADRRRRIRSRQRDRR